MRIRQQGGFTLVELSIVILIIGLLLGGLMMPLSVQRDNARVRQGLQQLETIEEAIAGFVLANGYLPCPATPASSGLSAPASGNCTEQHGFVPATTLDLRGSRNDDNLLLDPYGSPIRYSVTAADADGDGSWDFTTPGEIRDVTLGAIAPDLIVCSTATGSSASSCASANVTLSDSAPMVLYSLGKDWAAFSSSDQLENVGTTLGGGASGTNYRVANDRVFVARRSSDQSGDEYDDLVSWPAAGALYGDLVAGGHLP